MMNLYVRFTVYITLFILFLQYWCFGKAVKETGGSYLHFGVSYLKLKESLLLHIDFESKHYYYI